MTPAPHNSMASISSQPKDKLSEGYLSPVFVLDEPTEKVEKNDLKQVTRHIAAAVGNVDNTDSDDSEEDEEDDYDDNSEADIVEAARTPSDLDASGVISDPKKKAPAWKKYRGMMLAVLSSLIFTVSALLVKEMESYDPFNSALYKFQGALIPAIPLFLQKRYCSRKGARIVERVWPLTQRKKLNAFSLVILRSFLTCNALLLHFFSLKYLPIGDALTIASASPIFVAILAKIFLGEKCGYSTIIASAASIIGVVAIAKPPVLSGSADVNMHVLIGSGLAFGCTVVSAVSFIVLRYIRKVHYSVTTLMYGGWGSIECLILVLLIPGLRIPSHPAEWWLIAGLAGLTLIGQFAIILAMKLEQAGPVALVRTLDTLFGYIFQLVVIRTLPDLWSLVGAAMIVLSVAFVGVRKWARSYPKGHPIRRKLRFLSM